MNLGAGVHLTYCSNIHPGESWAEVRANLERHVVAVRDRLLPGGEFGVGLRLSARAAAELAAPAALAELRETYSGLTMAARGPEEYELLNLLTVATVVTECAVQREESRGVHLRDDFTATDDERWRRHLTAQLADLEACLVDPVTDDCREHE